MSFKIRARLALLVLLNLLIPAENAAAATPLMLDEAVNLALANQPLIAGQQAAIHAAEKNAVAAGQLPDPKLKFGLSDLPVTGSEAYSVRRDNFTEFKVGVSQDFPRAEKRRLRGAMAQLEAQRDTEELEVIRRAIKRDAALAWLEVFYPERAISLLQALEREGQVQLDALNIAYRAGRASQADVRASQVALDLLKDREADFARQASRSRASLARWIGAEASRPLAEILPDLPMPLDRGALLAHVENHPHLSFIDKQVVMAQTDVELARQAYKPDWSIEVSYGNRPAFPDFFSVQFGIDLPVLTKNRQDPALASKLSLLDKSRSLKEDALRALKADAERDYADWQSSLERVQRFDANILPQAKSRVDAALAAYQSGHGDLNAVLEARRAEFDLQLQRLGLQVDAARAQLQLQYFSQ
ncbi:MAG TPA: TolC family protein [Burkholderiales bacterium]|nr:TolC family protein [Burkholderiales bacterium]